MESKYKELKLLKQSEKSTVYLVCSGERKYIRKLLTGRHPIYELLMNNPHPGLPRLLEVTVSENSTTILEKYIEGQPLGTVELSKRQFSTVVRELCSVLTFLHGKGIIHRDIKPSNIILTEEGHVYLIDFDIAIENCIIKGFFQKCTKLDPNKRYRSVEQFQMAFFPAKRNLLWGCAAFSISLSTSGSSDHKRA